MPESSDSLRVAQVYTEFDTKGLSSTEKSINSLKGKLNSVRNVLAGIVGAFTLKSVAGSFVAAAKSAEDYRTSIRAVSKSIEEADAAFDRVRKWAAVNPVDTDEAVGAFVRLRTAAVANAEEALNAIADVSTVMHADMRDVASAVVTTETESLRQYGILLDQTGKKAVLESNGIRMEVDKNINAIRAGIIELMGRAFGGSMQEARDTFSGTLDTMSGMWTEFQQDIMGEGKNSGPFETLKSTLHEIRDEWEAFTQSQDYSKLVSGIQSTLVLSIETATSTIRAFGNAVLFAGEHIAELKAAFIALASYRGALAITTAVATFNEQLTMGMGLVPSATSLVAKMGRAFTLLQVQVATASTAIGGLRAAASALMASLGPAGWAALIAGGTAWLVLKERMEDAAEQAEITQRAIASVNQEFADANSAQIEKALKDAGKELAALEERALSAKLSLMELWNAKETYSDEELIIPEIGVALPKDTLAKAAGQNFSTEEYEAERTRLKERIEELKNLYGERQRLEDSISKDVPSLNGDTSSTLASGGKSAAEKLVENMRDQMKYLGKDGNEFLSILDRWQAKLPTLSKDWKTVTDLKFDILGENAERSAENADRVLKRIEQQKEAAKELAEIYERADREYLSGLSWENSQGLLSNSDYLDILKTKIEDLGLATKNVFNWTDKDKAFFSTYQNVGSQEFSKALDLIKNRYESGTVNAAQYKATLEQLKQQYADMPLVVKMADEALTALNNTMNKYPTAAQQASAAWDSAKEALYNFPTGIGNAFESAIRGTESLSDAMLGLLQDIGAVVAKALIMRALFGGGSGGGLLGGLFGAMHEGGPVGAFSGVRAIDPGVFSNAPRYHSGGVAGLAPDEVPAILQAGEVVIPKGARRSGGVAADTGDTYNITIQAVDSQSFAKMLEKGKGTLENLIVNGIQRGGSLRSAIKGATS